jgi:hypothetical protein
MSSLSPQPSPSPLKAEIYPLPTCFVLTITSRGQFPSLRPIITHTVFYSYASASGRLIASFNQLKDNLDEGWTTAELHDEDERFVGYELRNAEGGLARDVWVRGAEIGDGKLDETRE